MKFKSFVVFMVVFAFLFAACAPEPADVNVPQDGADGIATDEPTEAVDEPAAGDTSDMPAACQEDEFGCAVIPEGETIKIGMGAPLLGDYSMFGIDISRLLNSLWHRMMALKAGPMSWSQKIPAALLKAARLLRTRW